MSFREPEGQVARWLEQLASFQFTVEHRAGKSHQNADALSRRPCLTDECRYCSRAEAREVENQPPSEPVCQVVLPAETAGWRELQVEDPDLREVRKWVEDGRRPDWEEVVRLSATVRGLWSLWPGVAVHDGVLQRAWLDPASGVTRWQVVVPEGYREEVVAAHHGAQGVGHFGATKTLHRLRQAFYWGRCRRDVEDFCRRCDPCTARKGPQDQSRAPLQQYPVGAPMDRVAVDVLGPLPRTTQGNRYVLVAIDYFTKWPEAYALPDQEATTVVEALTEGFFCRFGTPSELHSDQGRNFESRVFAGMCSALGIRKTRTTPLHPQSDGLVERFMRTLGTQLALLTSQDQRDWDVQLPWVMLACRSAVQETTGCSPALLMLGRELRTPPQLMYGQPPDAPEAPAGPEYARQLQDRLDKAHKFARCQAETAGMRQKRLYDLRVRGQHFKAGDHVWVYSPKRKKGRSPKLDSKWIGPCYVVERVGEVVYRVRLAPRGRFVVLHRDRLAPYHGRGHPAFMGPGSPSRACVSPQTPASDFRVSPHGAVIPALSPVVLASPPGTGEPVGLRRSRRTRRVPRHFVDFEDLPWRRGLGGQNLS